MSHAWSHVVRIAAQLGAKASAQERGLALRAQGKLLPECAQPGGPRPRRAERASRASGTAPGTRLELRAPKRPRRPRMLC